VVNNSSVHGNDHRSFTTLEIAVEFHHLISHDVTKIINVNKADVDDDKTNR
jgi:hypothetical protein